MENENFEAIINNILLGKTEEFDRLYRATNQLAYFHAKNILRDEQDVLDAVQEAYLVAFQKINTLRNPKAVKHWICGIVSNISLNKVRKTKLESGLSLDDEDFFFEPQANTQDMPEHVLDQEATQNIIGKMIGNLPEVQRITAIMFYFDEMTVAQIAEAMECSENTIKSRLNYARKNLEKQVLSEEKRGVKLYSFTTSMVALALRTLSAQTAMPLAATETIAAKVAAGCGYSIGTIASGATAATSASAATTTAASAGAAVTISTKIVALIIAGVVAVGGLIAGIVSHHNKAEEMPSVAVQEEPASIMPAEQSKAFYEILKVLHEQFGICTQTSSSRGIAYVELIDFDNNGTKELYLYYIDDSAVLHEQVWAWTGIQAKLIQNEEHSNDGIYAGMDSSGRILFTEDGVTYLATLFIDMHMGTTQDKVTMQLFNGDGFVNVLESYEAFANDPEDPSYPLGSWYDGYVLRRDVKVEFALEDMVFTDIYEDGISGRADAADGRESPGSLYRKCRDDFAKYGKELIHSQPNEALSWEINDVKGLMDELYGGSGVSEEISAFPQQDGITKKQANAYYHIIAELQSAQGEWNIGEKRGAIGGPTAIHGLMFAKLMDFDSNGNPELLCIYSREDYEAQFGNTEYAIYGWNGKEAMEITSVGLDSIDGRARMIIYSRDGKTYYQKDPTDFSDCRFTLENGKWIMALG